MKIRLSQSKSGSTEALNLRHELLLQTFHFRSAGGRLVIKASKMKEAVRNVETQLVLERGPERARLATGSFRADDDFAVLESNHVGGAGFIEEAAMKLRNSSIGNEDGGYFLEHGQLIRFPLPEFQTLLQSALRKFTERR